MRSSAVLLLLALAGVLAGGALIGTAALGGCVIFESLVAGGYALFRDMAERPAGRHGAPTVGQVLERARDVPGAVWHG